jgi:very-short-patch-repair endonuclease
VGTSFARFLRSRSTDAERRLWFHFRGGRLSGIKFRRQEPIGPWVVDFVAFGARLVIELDGGQHLDRARYDAARSRGLERAGFRVIRFWNDDVLRQTDAVLDQILIAARRASPEVSSRQSLNPSPLVGEPGHAAACGGPACARARRAGRNEGQG